ncbi:hypothetical protein NQ318_000448 [Aromia moschata]|uniref:Uncharacterized protein n=1 Tax=Aromia moschata TaxID=1265417 RepID=A0AAV8YTB1_9CUCU|nr:hypothetical protein NQ318_000448 [Aromia moschata]
MALYRQVNSLQLFEVSNKYLKRREEVARWWGNFSSAERAKTYACSPPGLPLSKFSELLRSIIIENDREEVFKKN